EGPKWRLEHSQTGQAVCQQAACKRAKTKIERGELRIGTNTFFESEARWYIAWRHWGCATKHQIKGLIEVTGNDATQAPGYEGLSEEAQEEVRQAFENEGVVDKDFKGKRADLAKASPRYNDIMNAEGYKVDIAKRATGCRNAQCPSEGSKILKGEVRLGICVPFDGDHSSWLYKHWKCMSQFDFDSAQKLHLSDACVDGIDTLPEEHQDVVKESFETGKILAVPEPEPPVIKPKRASGKGKGKGKKVASDDEVDTPKPKRKGKKRVSDEMEDDDASEAEYIPKKTRSRVAKVEE
ncbi:hypothetical protein BKA63DRAFT_394085, partial [Paraphoma chrysanthemicola]